jgi:hypothetical protein
MTTRIPFRSVLLVTCGVLLGIAADRVGYPGALFPAVAAQQGRAAAPPPTLESLAADVAQLKAIQPSNSHIMMDVQFHWTNLWFAAQKKDWEFAQYQFNEMRGHIIWLTRKSPIIRAQDGTDVDIKSIFDGVDTSSLADVKAAIEKKDSVRFAAAYKTMIESCYSCHKSVGRPYLRPMIPTAPAMTVINLDPKATWPE